MKTFNGLTLMFIRFPGEFRDILFKEFEQILETRVRDIIKKIEDQQDDAKYSSLEAKFQDKVDNFIPVSYLFRFSKYYSQE